MNKLVNLVIIFLTLQYLVPLASNFEILQQSQLYLNLFAALTVGLIQFVYNYGMEFSKRKQMTFKENAIDSLFKMMIVFGGFYIFQDIETSENPLANALKSSNFFESMFITLLITFFILIKCLITP